MCAPAPVVHTTQLAAVLLPRSCCCRHLHDATPCLCCGSRDSAPAVQSRCVANPQPAEAVSCFFCCAPRSARGDFPARLRRCGCSHTMNACAAYLSAAAPARKRALPAASQMIPAHLQHPCSGFTPDAACPVRLVRQMRMMLTDHDLGALESKRLARRGAAAYGDASYVVLGVVARARVSLVPWLVTCSGI